MVIDDYMSLSAEEWAQLEDYQLQEALQLAAGYMAVAQAKMRENAEAFHNYMRAKEDFSRYRQIANIIQTVLRTKV